MAADTLAKFMKDLGAAGVVVQNSGAVSVPGSYFHPRAALAKLAFMQHEYFYKIMKQL
jgi:hypothetical protein